MRAARPDVSREACVACTSAPPTLAKPLSEKGLPDENEVLDVTAHLAAHALRPTPARTSVLELFRDGSRYTPEQVYRELMQRRMDVSLATAYRALAQFVESGILARQQFDQGPAYYSLRRPSPDGQLVCPDCGAVLPIPGRELAKVLGELAARYGATLSSYDVVLHGHCGDCSSI